MLFAFADGSLEMTEPNTKHAFHQIEPSFYIKVTLADGRNFFWEPWSNQVQCNLYDIKSLSANYLNYIALSNDGTIYPWGFSVSGDSIPDAQKKDLQGKKVIAIAST
jgi:hypothetical protein